MGCRVLPLLKKIDTTSNQELYHATRRKQNIGDNASCPQDDVINVLAKKDSHILKASNDTGHTAMHYAAAHGQVRFVSFEKAWCSCQSC
jgi:hypothetical protein